MRSFLIAVVLLTACSKPEPQTPAAPVSAAVPIPSQAEAAAIISASAELGDFEFTKAAYSLPLKTSMLNAETKAAAEDLKRAGWITIKGDAIAPAKFDDKRFLVRTNGFMDIVPLAKKEFGEVTAVRPDPDGAAADFTWKWVPNSVGQSFKSGPLFERYSAPQRATATLLRSGDSWTVLRIKPTQ